MPTPNVYPVPADKKGGAGAAIGAAIAGGIARSVGGSVGGRISSRGAARVIKAQGEADVRRGAAHTDDAIRIMQESHKLWGADISNVTHGHTSVSVRDNQNTGEPKKADTRVPPQIPTHSPTKTLPIVAKSPGKPTEAPSTVAPTAGGAPTRRAPLALAEGASTRQATKRLNPREAQPQPSAEKPAIGTTTKGPGEFPHPKDVAKAVRGNRLGKRADAEAAADELHPGWRSA